MVIICLRADVSYFLCCTRKTKEIGDFCTQARSSSSSSSWSLFSLVCWDVTEHSPRCVTSQKMTARETNNDEDDDYFWPTWPMFEFPENKVGRADDDGKRNFFHPFPKQTACSQANMKHTARISCTSGNSQNMFTRGVVFRDKFTLAFRWALIKRLQWMNEWMNGWMDGWMDGWMNEWPRSRWPYVNTVNSSGLKNTISYTNLKRLKHINIIF